MKRQLTEQRGICLITPPFLKFEGGDLNIVADQFLQVLEPLTKKLFFITGNYPRSGIYSPKIHLINVAYNNKRRSILVKALQYMVIRLKISYYLIKISSKIDIVVLLGMSTLLLPTIVAKLTGKKTIYVDIGSIANTVEQEYKSHPLGFIITRIFPFLESANYKVCDRVVVYSQSCIEPCHLKYKNKISVAPRQFLNFDRLGLQKHLDERDNMIGYIGRFEKDKGTMNFVESIPMVIKMKEDVIFFIGGDGHLRSKVEEYLSKHNLNDKVKSPGWISHNDLSEYLNELKLLVLPSYVEGLPNIMLEAMACGTPVLATAVGGIPDVIKDGETGFILKDNSPKTISQGVIRALQHPNLEKLTQNARAIVEKEYTYEAAVERYRSILIDHGVQGQESAKRLEGNNG